MKLKIPATLVLLFVAFLSSHGVFAGDERGNGTDNAGPGDGAAWFLGKGNTIQACVSISPEFSISTDEAINEVQSAFETWIKYISDKSIELLIDPKLQFATQLSVSPNCNGTEDLVVYFGGETEAIQEAKTNLYNPMALAERTSCQLDRGWAQGFIWINSDRTSDGTLGEPGAVPVQSLLLHEWGHVLGCAHVPGTIMDANMAQLVLSGAYTPNQSSRIDSIRELTMREAADLHSTGTLGAGGASSQSQLLSNLGISPSNSGIVANLDCTDFEKTCSLSFSSEGQMLSLPIQILGSDQSVFGGEIFKGAIVTGTTSITGNISLSSEVRSSYSYGYVKYGVLTGKSGKKLNVILEWNLDSTQLGGPTPGNRIRYFNGNALDVLFSGTS